MGRLHHVCLSCTISLCSPPPVLYPLPRGKRKRGHVVTAWFVVDGCILYGVVDILVLGVLRWLSDNMLFMRIGVVGLLCCGLIHMETANDTIDGTLLHEESRVGDRRHGSIRPIKHKNLQCLRR